MKCPICKGKGELPNQKNKFDINTKKEMVKILHKNGFSARQICKYLGYKSPNSITYILKI